jgi:hypothetical protein
MKFFSTLLLLTAITVRTSAAIFANSVDADAFVRSNAPTANYGGAGSLSVSGSSSYNITFNVTNGIADTFIRFNTAAMVSSFNSLFGANNWAISGAKLQVTEVGTPNNSIFDQGKGAFQIYWVADDNWTEGNGTPMMGSTTGGIVYTDESVLLTNTAYLGTFTNTSTSVTLLFPLALTPAFVGDAQAGGEVTLFFTAIDPQIGFTFNSRSFGTTSARPFLEISAAPVPGISAVSLSGTDVVLSATNGAAGGTYYILTSTNLSPPFSQWLPVATNMLPVGGNFSITATNAVNAGTPWQQFFILQTQ